MTVIPEVPQNLTDWLQLVLVVGAVIAGARKWLVNPIIQRMDAHAQEHQDGRDTRALVLKQLAPNGHEWELPADLQDKPLRDLVAKGIIVGRRVEAAVAVHDAYTRSTVGLLNTDREARGLPPLPPPPDGTH